MTQSPIALCQGCVWLFSGQNLMTNSYPSNCCGWALVRWCNKPQHINTSIPYGYQFVSCPNAWESNQLKCFRFLLPPWETGVSSWPWLSHSCCSITDIRCLLAGSCLLS